jgi:hypothetical protein
MNYFSRNTKNYKAVFSFTKIQQAKQFRQKKGTNFCLNKIIENYFAIA